MKRFVAVVAAGVIVAAVVMLLFFTIPFKQLNLMAYDFTMRFAGLLSPAAPITIVAIDEESLQREGPWRWNRTKLARLLDGVQSTSPRAIALDLMLDDAESESGDVALALAIGKGSPVILPARVMLDGSGRWARPQVRFLEAGARIGHVHTDPDFDGINRRVDSVKAAEGTLMPAFSLETLRAAGVAIDPDFEAQSFEGATVVRLPFAAIRFAGDTGNTFQQVSAWRLMDGSADPALLRDRIVLIGLTAEGLQEDRWFTPFAIKGLKTPGVEIHANAIDTFYAGRWIREISPDLLFGGLFILALILAWMDRRFEGARFYLAAFLLVPITVAVSWALMSTWNIWLPFPPFIATIALAVPGLQVWKVAGVNRDLDSKIERLSHVEEVTATPSGWSWSPAELVRQSAPAGSSRERWLKAIGAFEHAAKKRKAERNYLLAPLRKNAKWRLGAVDFFNEELVRFLEFNRAVLSSIEDVTIVSDVGGRIVYQNPAARRMTGFREDPPFAPHYLAQLLERRDFLGAFSVVFGEGKTVSLDFVPATGGRRFFNVVLAPIGEMGLVVSLHDVTSQHELNLAKNEMVSLVSHELRTPLTAIQGYSDLLLKYELVPEKGRKYLETILEESGRLGKLIQSFLDIAYIESGRKQLEKSDFEVGTMFRDLQSVLDPVASAKRIELSTFENGITRVRGDRTLLYQALTNLLTNAVKYSPEGSAIRLEASAADGHAAFRVADQGHGIAAEDVGRVFEKFFRCGNKETLEQSGFGLGLAFVKEVALQHGGEVTVESQAGKGSTFTLRIPL